MRRAGGTARRRLLAAAGVLGLLLANASAQVDYVRELIGTESIVDPVLASTQAPTNFSDPLYAPPATMARIWSPPVDFSR